jgi:hypothetical protein
MAGPFDDEPRILNAMREKREAREEIERSQREIVELRNETAGLRRLIIRRQAQLDQLESEADQA